MYIFDPLTFAQIENICNQIEDTEIAELLRKMISLQKEIISLIRERDAEYLNLMAIVKMPVEDYIRKVLKEVKKTGTLERCPRCGDILYFVNSLSDEMECLNKDCTTSIVPKEEAADNEETARS